MTSAPLPSSAAGLFSHVSAENADARGFSVGFEPARCVHSLWHGTGTPRLTLLRAGEPVPLQCHRHLDFALQIVH
jgi:hypothetical protein